MSIQGLGSNAVYTGAQPTVRPKLMGTTPSDASVPSQPTVPTTPPSGNLGSVINEKA
jgi:hypothetical protein